MEMLKKTVLTQSASAFFEMILSWAVEEGNIFVWVWTILQWNLMARSISIDPLALHNFSLSEDHFVVKHDSTKTDKEGERLHLKGVYCNPLDPMVCPGVSLGVFLSIEQWSFSDNSEKLFLRRGGQSGSASHRYCEQLSAIMKRHWDVVQTYITNMSAHGLRKGSATHVASATTCPPPIASIANRGDWSLPMEDEDILYALQLMYGQILLKHPGSSRLLL